jgi:hypothetical protein
MALSFPDPVIGTIVRPKGQGCTTCIFALNCRVFYWYKRESYAIDDRLGVACTSWSNDVNQQIKTVSEDDLAYIDRLEIEGIASEPNRNGLDDPVSAGPNQF